MSEPSTDHKRFEELCEAMKPVLESAGEAKISDELRAFFMGVDTTFATIKTLLEHPEFPVDIASNAIVMSSAEVAIGRFVKSLEAAEAPGKQPKSATVSIRPMVVIVELTKRLGRTPTEKEVADFLAKTEDDMKGERR